VSDKSKQALKQAEAKFRKSPDRSASATAEIRLQRQAIQDKTARLRALRLAKEAADAEAAAATQPDARKTR
jgi:hypothetical protein